MVDELTIIMKMYEVMEGAIRNGDWKPDGRCDPSWAMELAKDYLESRGCHKDGITGEEWLLQA